MSTLTALFLLIIVVALHEMGHALTALYYKIPVKRILIGISTPTHVTLFGKSFTFDPFTLWTFRVGDKQIVLSLLFIGGAVDIDSRVLFQAPAKQQAVIYLAGPAVNVVVGLVSAILFFGFDQGLAFTTQIIQATALAVNQLASLQVDPAQLASPITATHVASQFIATDWMLGIQILWLVFHLSLGVFNLVPFPGLDGGLLTGMALSRLTNKLTASLPQLPTLRGAPSMAFVQTGFLVGILATMLALVLRDILVLGNPVVWVAIVIVLCLNVLKNAYMGRMS